LRNPDDPDGVWSEYVAVEKTGNESPHYADVDDDGQRELVFIEGRRIAIARPGRDATRPWAVAHLGDPDDPAPAHGLGVGDVNRDGHVDILVPTGWWQNPGVQDRLPWPFRPATLFGEAQLCVSDLDGDGDKDVLGSRAHGYGIAWSEQMPDGWRQHAIDSDTSQTHALQLADLNGDGLLDFVTGKRFWAHNGRDPGSFEPAVLVWYEQRRAGERIQWNRHTIDVDSGVGLQVRVVDVNGDQLPDIVTSSKKGVHYFEQTRTGDRQ
jgi:hypothetical protein